MPMGSAPPDLSVELEPDGFQLIIGCALWAGAILLASGFDAKVLDLVGIELSPTGKRGLSLMPAVLLLAGSFVLGVRADLLRRSVVFWLPFMAFILGSVVWATNSSATMAKSVSTIIYLAAICCVASSVARDRFIYLLALSALFFGWASLALGAVAPDLAIGRGGFSGVFVGKGLLVDANAVALFAAAYLLSTTGQRAWVLVGLGSLICILIGSTVSAIFGLLVGSIAFFRRSIFRPLAIGLVAVGVILPLATNRTLLEPLVELVGRDMTFSGRTILWEYVLGQVINAPILGHGYANVGSTDQWALMIDEMFAITINSGFEPQAPHSHNLWLETLYMGGIAGLAGTIYYFVAVPIRTAASKVGIEAFALPLMTYMYATSMLKLPLFGTGLITGVLLFVLLRAFVTNEERAELPNAPAEKPVRSLFERPKEQP